MKFFGIGMEQTFLQAGAFLAAEAEGSESPSLWKIMLVLLASAVILILLRQSQRNRAQERIRRASPGGGIPAGSSPPPAVRKTSAAAPGAGPAQDPDVAKLYIELDGLVREMEGRLDTKIAYLRRLIAEAERVQVDLGRAVAEAEILRKGEPVPQAVAAPGGTPVPMGPESPEARDHEPRRHHVDVIVGGPPQPAVPEIPAAVAEGPRDALSARIVRLAEEGRPQEAIAEEVGIPKGEVELVLGLHRSRRGQGRDRS